ncbi:MAG TPA: MXAN_5187 C-terminal domain-containing protein [Terriglobia bacterium]|nr:MXAN_5187 C-terminal domain-containing protein [Terriglobia bacterium]
MTTDEELSKLEDSLRRLKIEYDVYFNGGSKRPPTDSQWRVETLIKKLQDTPGMNFGQRFRFNGLAQRYSLFSELWRQRLRVKEEGPRRTVAEMRAEQRQPVSFRVGWGDPAQEPEKVDQLFSAFLEAKRRCGESTENLGAEAFKRFVQQKTDQLKRDFQCQQVEYVVEVENGRVKLKAKGV